MDTFLPFTADYQYIFKTDAVYAAYGRLTEDEQALLPWGPHSLDWRTWFLEVHAPALERHVFPEMEARLKKKLEAPRAHQSLSLMLDQLAERYELRPALCLTEADGIAGLSYQDVRAAALRTAARFVALGIQPGDRVLLAGNNHPG